jgi:hypothetical protein
MAPPRRKRGLSLPRIGAAPLAASMPGACCRVSRGGEKRPEARREVVSAGGSSGATAPTTGNSPRFPCFAVTSTMSSAISSAMSAACAR